MNGLNRVIVLVAVGLALLVSQARATTLFQDDFEGYAATNTWPTTVPNCNPGTPPVGEPWYFAEPIAQYGIQVMADTAGQNYGAAGPHGGSNYLQSTFGGQGDVAGMPISAAHQTAIASGKDLTLDMWVWKGSSNGYLGQVTIAGYDSAPGSTTGAAFDLRFKDDGTVDYNNGAGAVATGLTYSVDTWSHLTVVASFATHTYNVTLGNQTATGLAFADGTISKIQHVLLAGIGNYDDRGAYDDIQMSTTGVVPEPSTLTLLVGGLFGLLAYAWRKRR
jgi:hypothetical protein